MRSYLKYVIAVLLLMPLINCSGEEGERRPNVLLISIDTLRPDHLGCYGYGRETSPSIDRLAREGVLFENHISSSSWTLPAHTAMFTSASDSVHGNMEATGTALSPAFTTVAERFAASGYKTGGFYAGPYLHEAFGLGQGFDTYQNCAETTADLASADVEAWAMDPEVMSASHRGSSNENVYQAARQFMEERLDQSFFCFMHLWDVHFDFTPPAPYDTMFDPGYQGDITGEGFFFNPKVRSGQLTAEDKAHLIALYDGEIRWTDETIKKLLADLDSWGLDEDTIVVLTSDHGTEFWEHGGIAHRTTLYDELIRVPLIVRYPRQLPGNRRVKHQTRIVDIAPTLCELADIPPMPHSDGSSLRSIALGKPLDFDNVALSELFSVQRRMRSVRTPEAKLIDDMGVQQRIWFDLQADRGELRPRGDLDVGTGADMQALFESSMTRLDNSFSRRPGAPVAPDLPEGVLDSLKGFGYVGTDDE
ncbi:MAG: arylsulfatase A-like enzyme [Planctomycetota bacterium]|jgi:arylsulfatase A-like enzyme